MAVDRVLGEWSHHRLTVEPGSLFEFDSAPLDYAGKPDCFVNESGGVLRSWVEQLDLDPESLLVVYDDFSLDLGTIRLRPSGSAGGHRGLSNVIDVLGTDQIPRLRIGIGPLPSSTDPADFVLSPITDNDRPRLNAVLETIPDVVETLQNDGLDTAMSRWNGVELDARR